MFLSPFGKYRLRFAQICNGFLNSFFAVASFSRQKSRDEQRRCLKPGASAPVQELSLPPHPHSPTSVLEASTTAVLLSRHRRLNDDLRDGFSQIFCLCFAPKTFNVVALLSWHYAHRVCFCLHGLIHRYISASRGIFLLLLMKE